MQYQDWLAQSKKIEKDQMIYINLELLIYDGMTYTELNKHILELTNKKYDKTYLFFDEIQNVKEWEKCINSLYSLKKYDIYITGSNSRLLSTELSTLLSGRYVNIPIFPFNYKEILQFFSIEPNFKSFLQYLNYGGLPQILEIGDNKDKETLILDLYNSIIIKDVADRYNIKNIQFLKKTIMYLINNSAKLLSGKNIIDAFIKDGNYISNRDLYNLLDYVVSSSLFYKAKRFDLKGKKILSFEQKYYLVDNCFRNLLISKDDQLGRKFENLIYNELICANYNVNIGKFNDCEIDFVVTNKKEIFYIQVAYSVEKEDVYERETKPLLSVNDNYPKYLVTLDDELKPKDGIKHIKAIDFILNMQKYLEPGF